MAEPEKAVARRQAIKISPWAHAASGVLGLAGVGSGGTAVSQPDVADIEQGFEELASTLANLIRECYIYPLQQEYFDERGVPRMLTMKEQAGLIAERTWPKNMITVALNVGSIPPPNPKKPVPTPRKPKKAAGKRR